MLSFPPEVAQKRGPLASLARKLIRVVMLPATKTAFLRQLLGLLLAAALSGCGSQGKSGQEERRTSEAVERRDIREEIRLSGDIAPAYQVEIKPEVGGKVRELLVTTGQQVKKGDLLFVIDDRDLQIEKSSAQVEIDGAKVSVEKLAGNLGRARELFEAKLISKEVYDNLDADSRLAENAFERAQRRLETVEDRIERTRVLAPADGTILSVPVIAGQVVVAAMSVNSGTALATLADLSTLLIDAHVNQLDIGKIAKGSTVEVLSGTEAETRTTARLTFIAPLATTKNNVKGFSIQAVLDEGAEDFRPGMTVGLRLPLAAATNAISVPVSAVFGANGDKLVYVETADGKVEKRPVEVGVSDLFHAEIKSGLQEGERVLLTEPPPEQS
jgi:RND family efflux transporter MFP subunit